MSDTKDNLTKYTGYYRCPDETRHFKIRIRLKEVDLNNYHANRQDEWHTQTFSWQEKHFSKIERDFYSDINNCVTDLEKQYNAKIAGRGNVEDDSIFFTYVDEDGFTSEQEVFRNKISYLQYMMEKMDVEYTQPTECEYDFNNSLISSVENKIVTKDFEKMYIMADLGEYIENIWIKNDQVLCVLKFDRNSNVLYTYPDFTTTEPYLIKIHGEDTRKYSYFVENHSMIIPEDILVKENEIIDKINCYKRTLKKRIVGDVFSLPPKNKLFVHLFFEILLAKNFEYSDIYVQYLIDLPVHWSCADTKSLTGVTQTGRGIQEDGLVHFGHGFDVVLEYDLQSLQNNALPKTPFIYFEVVSRGTWDRYRTEGLAYKNLPISNPGCYCYNLSCFRLNTQGPSGNLRRFFIGDCSKYKDITWIGLPKDHAEKSIVNKFGVNTVGTGELKIRVNVLHQSQAFLEEYNESYRKEKYIYEKLNASSLIKSVEQVLIAFKRARKNMIEVRDNL